MNDRKVLFGLHELKGIGWRTINRLMTATGGEIASVAAMSAAELIALGLKSGMAETIAAGLRAEAIDRRLEAYDKRGISILTALDEAYPPLLKEIAQPPWVLYYRGDLRVLQRPAIAIVGTRTPTAYGSKVAFELARGLSARGICVVSGLARGIDSRAHRGALDEAGGTAAVLGCAPDIVYPRENASLHEEIARKGIWLTEYPLGTPMTPGLFPQRNRIIAGLSLGTVVVEAAADSGSLITAHQALEQSRDVFSVPGPITSPNSSGTLELLRQGAKLVAGVDDIMEEYVHLLPQARKRSKALRDSESALASEERNVLALLAGGPATFDELLELTGYEFGLLHSVLLNLTLAKKVVALPGSSYVALQ